MTRKNLLKELCNTTAEIHALSLGIYAGLSETRSSKMPTENPDVAMEPHYWAGGYIFGTVLKYAMTIYIVHTIV